MHVGTVHGARECKVLVYVYDAGRGTQDPGRDGYWSDLDFELRRSNIEDALDLRGHGASGRLDAWMLECLDA